MPPTSRSNRSRRKKSARWIVLAIVLCSAMSCVAPVLYASTDCSRWLAEYKQGILQRRATRKLRAAKYRLTVLVHKPTPPRTYPMRHRMSPLESLRRFQIDCGDLENVPAPPMNAAVIPPLPVEPVFALVRFPEVPPDLPAPDAPVLVAEAPVPALLNVPVAPVLNLPSPSETPEPGSLILVLTGTIFGAELLRRKARAQTQAVALNTL